MEATSIPPMKVCFIGGRSSMKRHCNGNSPRNSRWMEFSQPGAGASQRRFHSGRAGPFGYRASLPTGRPGSHQKRRVHYRPSLPDPKATGAAAQQMETWSQLCLDYLVKADPQEAETGVPPSADTLKKIAVAGQQIKKRPPCLPAEGVGAFVSALSQRLDDGAVALRLDRGRAVKGGF